MKGNREIIVESREENAIYNFPWIWNLNSTQNFIHVYISHLKSNRKFRSLVCCWVKYENLWEVNVIECEMKWLNSKENIYFRLEFCFENCFRF
jgi:hypothetical protein